jgi:hypothetical protein
MSNTGAVIPTQSGHPQRGFDSKLPSTKLGRASMWIALGFLAMALLSMVVIAPRGMSTDPAWTRFSATYLPYWAIALVVVGSAAGVVGLVAILKDKERSILTLFATIIGLGMIAFVLADVGSGLVGLGH